ncbi:MAG TPA: DeoR/GlpR family DNA-binding transcription regulator [Pseudonocardiaceae bacterium]|jgi:DeoR/GlpR family transcriptional regulator of sugar metabolism|nr:DeoR/GlpR family DNA-binding transcription regulator [Pseudonocardiaceae bacterium]
MLADERQHSILERLRADGRLDVRKLAANLGVSAETVRRDLRLLEHHGLIRRVHGGAYPVESPSFETTLASRTTHHIADKRRIAAAAAELVGDAETVFVDEGITPQLIAEALPTDRPLTVVTAALPTAAMLAAIPTMTVIQLGGRVRGRTLATVDHWVVSMLAGLVIDLAYIGANGISRQHGLTTPDPAVAGVKAQAIRSSRRRIFSGIHTKFGVSSFCRFGDVRDFDVIVTDSGLPTAEARRYTASGPQVLRV